MCEAHKSEQTDCVYFKYADTKNYLFSGFRSTVQCPDSAAFIHAPTAVSAIILGSQQAEIVASTVTKK